MQKHRPDLGSAYDRPAASTGSTETSLSPRRYQRLLRNVVLSTASVAVIPLLIMTGLNLSQSRQAIQREARHPISRLTSAGKLFIELFLQERATALRMIVNSGLVTKDCSNEQLAMVLKSLRRSLSFGAFADIGVIGPSGHQTCYAGPYALLGKDYRDQCWYHRVMPEEIYISDVLLGDRNSPHFVIAIRHEGSNGQDFIVRVTVDAERLYQQLLLVGARPSSDIFIINHKGILQSPSRRCGGVLEKAPLLAPPKTDTVEVTEKDDPQGNVVLVGYSYIKDSPFILMLVVPSDSVMEGWLRLKRELIAFLTTSIILILLVVVIVPRKLVRSLRESDMARAQIFHQMEYTNKLACVGRLAAGVAHEINNPLAIINERAGLLMDRISMGEDFPDREKALQTISSILRSVERCSAVTHRLLGFARHMDMRLETINLPDLLKEVLEFLGKEASCRNIEIEWEVQQRLPSIRSDRGQLQQVFLNIINNAFAAVKDGGHIEISIRQMSEERVSVAVQDDGIGIPPENLKRIFEPFFTTKPGVGTGLGLSVTYGIVQKLGGSIHVDSEFGARTRFTVVLPLDVED